jgi:hypothetical protein
MTNLSPKNAACRLTFNPAAASILMLESGLDCAPEQVVDERINRAMRSLSLSWSNANETDVTPETVKAYTIQANVAKDSGNLVCDVAFSPRARGELNHLSEAVGLPVAELLANTMNDYDRDVSALWRDTKACVTQVEMIY